MHGSAGACLPRGFTCGSDLGPHRQSRGSMLKLEDISKNAAVAGIEPGAVVRIVTTEPVGDNALTGIGNRSN